MPKLKNIYTEKVHHIHCVKCFEATNTNNCSHEFSKNEAVRQFELEGWKYFNYTGWVCPDCIIPTDIESKRRVR